MLYRAKLSTDEASLLASLVGRNLNRVTTDGWSVELELDGLILHVAPEDVATPDTMHPSGDVDRPKIELIASAGTEEHRRLLADSIGRVKSVHLISVLTSFSAMQPVPPIALLGGVTIPEGEGYGWIYYRPSEHATAISEVARSQAVVDLDVAIEISTENQSPVVLYTRGYFVHASIGSLPTKEEWVRLKSHSSRLAI